MRHVQNPPAIKIYHVKFENRLPIEGKGQVRDNSDSEKINKK